MDFLTRIKRDAKNGIKDGFSIDELKNAIDDHAFDILYRSIYENLRKICTHSDKVKDQILHQMFLKCPANFSSEIAPIDFLCDCIWNGYISDIAIETLHISDNFCNMILHMFLIKKPNYIINNYDYFCAHAYPNTIIKYIKSDISDKPILKLTDFRYLLPRVFIECNIVPTKDEIHYMITNYPNHINGIIALKEFDSEMLYTFLNSHRGPKYIRYVGHYFYCEDVYLRTIYREIYTTCHEEFEDTYFDMKEFLKKNLTFVPDDKTLGYIIECHHKDIFEIIKFKTVIKKEHIDKILSFDRKFAIKYIKENNIPVDIDTLNNMLINSYTKLGRYGYSNTTICDHHKAARFILNYKILPNDASFDLAINYNDKRMLQMFVDNNFMLDERHIKKLHDNNMYPEELYNPDLSEYDYFRMFICDIHHNAANSFPPELRNQIILRQFISLDNFKAAKEHISRFKLHLDRYCADILSNKPSRLAIDFRREYKIMPMSNISGCRHTFTVSQLFEKCKANGINAEYMCKKN